MAQTWTLADLRAEFRSITGRSTTADISDSDVNDWINDYYQNFFPEETGVTNFRTDFTQELLPTDSGEYTLAQTVVTVEEPVTINGVRIQLLQDKALFFDEWPEDEHYITPPSLAIGTDTTKVLNAAFSYQVGTFGYNKASTETALSGDPVPQSKYGGWMLTIDAAGDIAITEAPSNSDGYATAAIAIHDLATTDQVASMGFVTAINTGGTFVPGTTALDAATVSDTYTDGRPGLRNTPTSALVFGNKLFVRTRPDDIFQFKASMTLQRPDAMATDAAVPGDVTWGQAIATGASIKWLATKEGEIDRLGELAVLHRVNTNSIKRKRILQWINADRPAGS